MVTRLPALLSRAQTVLQAMTSMPVGLWRASPTSSGFQVVPLHSTISSLMLRSWLRIAETPPAAGEHRTAAAVQAVQLRGLDGSVNCDSLSGSDQRGR